MAEGPERLTERAIMYPPRGRPVAGRVWHRLPLQERQHTRRLFRAMKKETWENQDGGEASDGRGTRGSEREQLSVSEEGTPRPITGRSITLPDSTRRPERCWTPYQTVHSGDSQWKKMALSGSTVAVPAPRRRPISCTGATRCSAGLAASG